MYSPSEKVLSS